MSVALWIVIGIAAFLVLLLVVSYNRFVAQRTGIRESFSNIDTELRRRHDLIPNLVETVKGYAAHERETLENVTAARARAVEAGPGPQQRAEAEAGLVGALRQLFAVAENYPDLKANQNFLQLQGELAETENRIQGVRRIYNDTVQAYNQRVQSVPSNIVARLFGFKEEPFFEIEPAVRETVEEPPQVDFSR